MKSTCIFVDENCKEYSVVIGNNCHENTCIINKSHPNDIWFHLENMSGPHIILKSEGDYIPKRYLNKIATFFRDHKTGLSSRFSVIYTEIKNVQTTKVPGQVITKRIKVIKI